MYLWKLTVAIEEAQMKTYRYFFRSCAYIAILIATIWNLSNSVNIEDNQSQPIVTVEFNQQLSNKEEVLKEEYTRKKKTSFKKIAYGVESQESLTNSSSASEKGVTILMYHYTSEKNETYMSVPKEKFREQMKYLKENGYTVIGLDELYSSYNEGISIPDNAVIITFDDGYANNYLYAYPILKEFGFKATIFMITSKINEPQYLTERQLKELDKNGIAIESHTVSHPQLGHLTYLKQLEELKNSKLTLESILGRKIKYIAYPYGEFNKDTIIIANDLDYKMGVTTVPSKAKKSNGLYTLNRIAVRAPIDMQHFKTLLIKK
jgi:peptidoglycan/xylan/chitin deacetylase (PgdA/CDA1 family)